MMTNGLRAMYSGALRSKRAASLYILAVRDIRQSGHFPRKQKSQTLKTWKRKAQKTVAKLQASFEGGSYRETNSIVF